MAWHSDLEHCTFKASEFDREQFENFAAVLSELGISFNYEISASGRTAKVEVSELPDKWDARKKRTRNAGRPSMPLWLPGNSIFDSETTCAEFLEWLETHTAAEAMEQLGLTRSTYFRRLKSIRELVEWERVHNPQRKREGLKELHHTLIGVR